MHCMGRVRCIRMVIKKNLLQSRKLPLSSIGRPHGAVEGGLHGMGAPAWCAGRRNWKKVRRNEQKGACFCGLVLRALRIRKRPGFQSLFQNFHAF